MTAAAPGVAGRAGQQRVEKGPLTTQDIVAGLLTSTLHTTATYPVHRVKILIQTQDANPHILSGKVARYSFVESFARLLKEQGPMGLWRGNTPYLLRHVPSIALSFTIKDALRDKLLPRAASTGSVGTLVANTASGGLAGAVALAVVYPFEFATVRMAADVGQGSDRQYGHSMRAAWLQAIRKEGLLSAYRGFGVAVASTFVYKSLYFGLYDSAKPIVLGPNPQRATTPSGLLLRTGLAAATTFASATIAYPLDIIRKRLIVDAAAEVSQYGGSFRRCVREIARREGIRGFYRFYGLDMSFRVFGGLVLVGYDLFRDLLQQRHRNRV